VILSTNKGGKINIISGSWFM